jgi:hypothetical protein
LGESAVLRDAQDMRRYAATVIPIVGFAALFLLALADVRVAAGRPHAQVHQRARAYGDALAAGDPVAAAGFHRDLGPKGLATAASTLRGGVFWIGAVGDDAGGIVTTLLWGRVASSAAGAAPSQLTVRWVRGAKGWQIVP